MRIVHIVGDIYGWFSWPCLSANSPELHGFHERRDEIRVVMTGIINDALFDAVRFLEW